MAGLVSYKWSAPALNIEQEAQHHVLETLDVGELTLFCKVDVLPGITVELRCDVTFDPPLVVPRGDGVLVHVPDPPAGGELELCPMGCGRATEDPYGGPCQACWEKDR